MVIPLIQKTNKKQSHLTAISQKASPCFFNSYSFTKYNLDLLSLTPRHSASLLHSNLALPTSLHWDSPVYSPNRLSTVSSQFMWLVLLKFHTLKSSGFVSHGISLSFSWFTSALVGSVLVSWLVSLSPPLLKYLLCFLTLVTYGGHLVPNNVSHLNLHSEPQFHVSKLFSFLFNLLSNWRIMLYRILFSVRPQHVSAIGIHISPPIEPPSHLPPHPTPLVFFFF